MFQGMWYVGISKTLVLVLSDDHERFVPASRSYPSKPVSMRQNEEFDMSGA